MESIIHFILDMPVWLAGLLLFLFSISWPSLIIYRLRRHIPHEKHKTNNEVGGFIYAVLGVAYAVVLAFVVLVDYEEYHKAESLVFAEANAINNFQKDLHMFEEPFKSEAVREGINYAKLVVDHEWKTMNHGNRHDETDKSMERLEAVIYNYSPKTDKEKLFYPFVLGYFKNMREMRLDRLIMSTSSLPGILYFVIIVGYFITVAYTFFFSSLSVHAQITMTSLLSMSLVLIVFLIVEMDLPFSGSTAVSPEPIEFVIKNIIAAAAQAPAK